MPLIHILDDSREFLETLHMVFPVLGFEFDSSDNLSSFYKNIQQRKPDLIMIDMVAPYWEGGVICRTLKDHVHYKNIPVVLFSGHHQLLHDYTRYAADDVIEKPFNFLTLSKKINQQIILYTRSGVPVSYPKTVQLKKVRKLAVKSIEFIEDKNNVAEMIAFIADVNGCSSYLAKDPMDLYVRLSKRELPDLIIVRFDDYKKAEAEFSRVLGGKRKNLIPMVMLVGNNSPVFFSNIRYHVIPAPFALNQLTALVHSLVR